MKKPIILAIIMIISFILSTMFFFNSGFFDFETGQVMRADANQILSELNNFKFINLGIDEGLIEDSKFQMPSKKEPVRLEILE